MYDKIISIDVARGERLVRGLERLDRGEDPLRTGKAIYTAEGLRVVGQLSGAVRNAYRVFGAIATQRIVDTALREAALETAEELRASRD